MARADRISATFHARDIFAPVTAHLVAGIDPANFGDPIQDFEVLDTTRPKVGALTRILEKFNATGISVTVEGNPRRDNSDDIR